MGFNIAVAVVAALAGGIASIAGFGIGSLLTPLVASAYGMETAVGAVAIPHFIATVLRFWRLRSDVDRRVFFEFGLMNASSSLAGALIHVWVNDPILMIVLGVLLGFAGIVGVLGYAARMRFSGKTASLAGTLSGAFGGLVGNQGGIRSAAMLGLGVQGPAFVATATAIGVAVDAVRMPVYFASESRMILDAWPVVIAGTIGVVLDSGGGTCASEDSREDLSPCGVDDLNGNWDVSSSSPGAGILELRGNMLSFAKTASAAMSLRCNAFITVMKTAELRDCDDPADT